MLAVAALAVVVFAWITLTRMRGRDPSALERAAAAALVGVTLSWFLLFIPTPPFVALAAVAGSVAVAAWALQRDWWSVAWFLMGLGDFRLLFEASAAVNDATDAGISRPGWAAEPVIAAALASLVGSALLIAGRRRAPS
jgi:hypothetical protein